jgi:hypothetical protein
MTIKELKQALSQYNDEDIVRLSSCDDEGNEVDLFDFYIDEIRDCEFINGDKFTEVRICQLPHKDNIIKLKLLISIDEWDKYADLYEITSKEIYYDQNWYLYVEMSIAQVLIDDKIVELYN